MTGQAIAAGRGGRAGRGRPGIAAGGALRRAPGAALPACPAARGQRRGCAGSGAGDVSPGGALAASRCRPAPRTKRPGSSASSSTSAAIAGARRPSAASTSRRCSSRAASSHPESALIARSLVWQALERLPPRRRAILVLYELEGTTIPAIARLLGVTRRDRALAPVGRAARDGRDSALGTGTEGHHEVARRLDARATTRCRDDPAARRPTRRRSAGAWSMRRAEPAPARDRLACRPMAVAAVVVADDCGGRRDGRRCRLRPPRRVPGAADDDRAVGAAAAAVRDAGRHADHLDLRSASSA